MTWAAYVSGPHLSVSSNLYVGIKLIRSHNKILVTTKSLWSWILIRPHTVLFKLIGTTKSLWFWILIRPHTVLFELIDIKLARYHNKILVIFNFRPHAYLNQMLNTKNKNWLYNWTTHLPNRWKWSP